ncbi:hypothetical protein DdX_16028 [Ditylenchus destructor]|uniref:Uncharacterized protein n=1 Tax=Ditylenchus destructor TaxID=166010 RepID=A0AAD4MTT3_9BILA|nr:hypothetical protein DdX_16028 [Ditylenchus destructor]
MQPFYQYDGLRIENGLEVFGTNLATIIIIPNANFAIAPKQSVSKQGIYGIIGDGQHKKVCFFIKVEPAEEGPALAEFKRGFFFRYNDVR